MIILDTNVVSELMRPQPAPRVVAWARGQSLAVHGWVYTLRDGRVHDLGLDVAGVDQLEPQYAAALARIHDDREDR